MRRATLVLAPILALMAATPAVASVRIEKTVTVRPAPHGGVRPDGTFEAGQSVQDTVVALPATAVDCDWTLTDPRTGRMPADPFQGQQWRLVFAGLERRQRWVLTVRVLNFNTRTTREPVRRWRLRLDCSTTRRPPTCFAHPIRAPKPRDYVLLGFHCRRASTRFQVTVPAGYAVRSVLGADNSLLHEEVDCTVKGRVIACRGRTPADTTTSIGFFLTTDVRRGMPVEVQVPRARAVRERTRTLAVVF